jgi:hypothetical protein
MAIIGKNHKARLAKVAVKEASCGGGASWIF